MGTVMDDLGSERAPRRPLRADAARNREQIMRATVEMVLEFGHAVPMEVIARRAGVGVATLYRHFPDRANLYLHVQLDVLTRLTEEAAAAMREEKDAFGALARYMHTAVDLRVSAIVPMLADRLPENADVERARARSRAATEALVAYAHRERALRPEVSTVDIALLVVRVSRPIPGVSTAENLELSHRHLELLLDGFVHFLGTGGLPGPVVSAADQPDRP
jgi:AcrR family transcriptional regulator